VRGEAWGKIEQVLFTIQVLLKGILSQVVAHPKNPTEPKGEKKITLLHEIFATR